MLEMGRAEEAINALDRALAIQPDNLDALTTKAEALTILGRYDVGQPGLRPGDGYEFQKI